MMVSNNVTNELEQYWDGFEPLFLFRRGPYNMFYDTGTNKLLTCEDEAEAGFLEYLFNHGKQKTIQACREHALLLEGAERVLESIRSERVLLSDHRKIRVEAPDYYSLATKPLQYLLLEMTEACNLRCKYCLYSGKSDMARLHGQRHMSIETAKKAIDFYLSTPNLKPEDVLDIGFYGGEPLLNWPVLQASVEYARRVSEGRQVRFHMTTNATLLTEARANWLAEQHFSLLISLDGPAEINDANRFYINGNGSFEQAIQGLKWAQEAHARAGNSGMVCLSMVYAPPYFDGKPKEILKLWDQYPWLAGVEATITYPSEGTVEWEVVDREDRLQDHMITEHGINEKFTNRSLPSWSTLYKRVITDEPVHVMGVNGCCMPGVRKLYVDVEGTFRLCERVRHDSPTLGNVDAGIDESIRTGVYVHKYIEYCLEKCVHCWANRICDQCYIHAFKGDKFDPSMKDKACVRTREVLAERLALITLFSIEHPEILEPLATMEIE